MVTLFKTFGTKMDLLISREAWPEIVGYIRLVQERGRLPLGYEREEMIGDTQVKLINLTGTPRSLSDLVEHMMKLDKAQYFGENRDFYILLHEEKKGTKNAGKDRKEIRKGSNGGNPGEETHPAA